MLSRDVVAQEEVKDYLLQAVDGNRLPHALLFLGMTGYGTLATAYALAQYIMCENKSGGEACNKCTHCHKARKYIHPDIHFTYPTIGSKMTSGDILPSWRSFVNNGLYQDVQAWFRVIGGESKQGNITKDECDRILKILSLKTYEGSHKILIIWMAEYLGAQGNRLLKIIEEPPENTVFVLIAERQEEVLNTILSRCQIIPFRPLPEQDIADYLVQKVDNLEEASAKQLAFLGKGNLITSLTLAEHANQKITDLWIDWMRVCYKGHGLEVNPWIDNFAKLNKEAQKAFLHFGLHFLREMLLFHISPNYAVHLQETEKSALIKMSKILNYQSIEEMINMVEENIFHLERNINSKILLLDSSIRMHYLLRNESAKLEAMLTS